ncbi:uncharacterized protein LOC105380288 isoform X3 [Plutella xylostella]|uniref:uncharacterized protein LOC105380288 isoform X3 n=1 Tax=Plutella xylostella TaxID=51655 RepID=UPI002032B303|nr:uncharacterized protein LOC105380288 isoform X3 [Plutella xylostella]
MAENDENMDSDGPIIDDNVIRIQLRKPNQRKWELRTRNLSPSVRFPTIQLFDCDGNLLVETNDDNISIKSSDFDVPALKNSQSLREKDFRHVIHNRTLKKHNTISGDIIYTRVFRAPLKIQDNNIDEKLNERYVIKNDESITNIPNNLTTKGYEPYLQPNSIETTPFHSDLSSDVSSLKSTDNEMSDSEDYVYVPKPKDENINTNKIIIKSSTSDTCTDESIKIKPIDTKTPVVLKSKSFNDNSNCTKDCRESLKRSHSGVSYTQPNNKISFLNTYLKSLPHRTDCNPDWAARGRETIGFVQRPPMNRTKAWKPGRLRRDHSSEDLCNVPSDVAADYELKKRLKIYRRGISENEHRERRNEFIGRRYSVNDLMRMCTSSSESLDEADLVLSRLRRRILRNKLRERHQGVVGPQKKSARESSGEGCQDAGAAARARVALGGMGSNISQHSSKGLKGRRARSSGDLCNGDSKSQTESSVCGSVVGDVMGWNRSLPNHLDGNRHLADYSRMNNNCGDFVTGTYNRQHAKGARGLRYRVSKSGSDAEPVWKLQDPGCDQGFGSERSPEEDCAPALPPAPVSLEEYEAQLRAVYPFIDDQNTFTVVVEKDGRGLGMSVCGGGGLVRIRRLYPPQPAWRTGRLAPRDLLLAANGVPLAGLSTYEALEVLRTAAPRVELRVCRPPLDVLESVTPPEPPTPPARTPHPPHTPCPPPDPLNCHPMHARLSATTSSATTSSSEGRGRRDGSPDDRRDLHLPDLDRPLPVYVVQYGNDGSVEFDIVMTKVNGSLGFTLRKEDHSALGHYVRALVREPALSDGRIQPGDRIVAVNDTPMSNMSHADAVSFLRACGAEVRLRLYRDHAATPLSPLSPREEGPTDSDAPSSLTKPKPPLRPEAVSMLCDLAARRLTPDAVDGSRSPCLSPRKFRKLTKENHYEQPIVPPHGYELNNLDNETLDAPNLYQEDISQQRYPEPTFHLDSNEPVSMPVELISDEARFKHSNPAYQSAVLHTTSGDGGSNTDGHKDDGKGLKKWKGVTLSPDNERKSIVKPPANDADAVQKENIKPDPPPEFNTNTEPTVVTVELNRGWNSRLGFSVQSHPQSAQSYISAVYDDSVAARDGRLRPGDVILQVNDENVTSMKTPEVIDLLRILRGSICITVLRPPNSQ